MAPIEPAVGYRIDYRGRSVVISGDSVVTKDTRRIANKVDLLLHDALALPLIVAATKAAPKQVSTDRQNYFGRHGLSRQHGLTD